MRPLFPAPHGIHFILDWDGTVTQTDTLHALVSICKTVDPAAQVSSTWSQLTQSYITDYEATLQKLLPNHRLPTSIPDERNLLLALEAVEQRSITRVSASGLFTNLTPQRIQTGAQHALSNAQIRLRNGYLAFEARLRARRILQGEQDADIRDFLSVNWSRQFIAACLAASSVPVEALGDIYANELEAGIITAAPSNPEGVIISSGDKLRTLKSLRSQYPSKPVVYVGDSWTDLECLLEADLGICVRDDPVSGTQQKLNEAFGRLGIACPHIGEGWRERGGGREGSSVVWARDFAEIGDWVLGEGEGESEGGVESRGG